MKIRNIFLTFVITALMVPQTFAAENAPVIALKSMISAVQAKDAEKAFVVDYVQQQKTQGKFKVEVQQQKDTYKKLLAGNPSLCPVEASQGVPCDAISSASGGRFDPRNIVLDIGLFIPVGSKYAVIDTVLTGADKSGARLLVTVEYPTGNSPVLVSNLKARQIYGGIAPIPPMFGDNYGYVTSDNSFLSSTECGRGTRFPFSFDRKDIKKAIFEFEAKKIDKKWFISGIRYDKSKFE